MLQWLRLRLTFCVIKSCGQSPQLWNACLCHSSISRHDLQYEQDDEKYCYQWRTLKRAAPPSEISWLERRQVMASEFQIKSMRWFCTRPLYGKMFPRLRYHRVLSRFLIKADTRCCFTVDAYRSAVHLESYYCNNICHLKESTHAVYRICNIFYQIKQE